MSIKTNLKQTKVTKIDKILSAIVCLSTIFLLFITIGVKQNNYIYDKSAQAAGPNTSNLIIGTNDTGSAIELSVCVQATPGPVHPTNASVWFQFDTTALTPTSGTFVEKGRYNGTDGYGQLKWNQVAGALSGNLDKYTMNLAFSGDGISAGQSGLLMSSSVPELFGKISFAKVTGSTASTAINLNKNVFFSTEVTTTAIAQTVTNVTGDCRGIASPSSLSSSSSSSLSLSNVSSSLISSSLSSSSIISSLSSSISSVTPISTGGGVIVICASICPQSSSSSSSSQISSQPFNQSSTPAKVNGSGAFKSKLHITDPYICGEGAYGNVINPKQSGIDYVYYQFYKNGATDSSYNYKLKMNENGDFFLPISKSINVIADGNYRVVFYAYDGEGNKAQGEYTAQIASDCANAKVNGLSTLTIRTGGIQVLQIILLAITLISLVRFYKLSKTEEITLKM